jgi:hypothetical protein
VAATDDDRLVATSGSSARHARLASGRSTRQSGAERRKREAIIRELWPGPEEPLALILRLRYRASARAISSEGLGFDSRRQVDGALDPRGLVQPLGLDVVDRRLCDQLGRLIRRPRGRSVGLGLPLLREPLVESAAPKAQPFESSSRTLAAMR